MDIPASPKDKLNEHSPGMSKQRVSFTLFSRGVHGLSRVSHAPFTVLKSSLLTKCWFNGHFGKVPVERAPSAGTSDNRTEPTRIFAKARHLVCLLPEDLPGSQATKKKTSPCALVRKTDPVDPGHGSFGHRHFAFWLSSVVPLITYWNHWMSHNQTWY